LCSCRYFDEISQDTGKYCFGVDDTLQCLDMGAVETLVVWENLEARRHAAHAGVASLTDASASSAGEPARADQSLDERDVREAPHARAREGHVTLCGQGDWCARK
jgi:peptide chain release factor subunit 1